MKRNMLRYYYFSFQFSIKTKCVMKTTLFMINLKLGHAQSKADFINKLSIGLQEANEIGYWLSLLNDSDFMESLA